MFFLFFNVSQLAPTFHFALSISQFFRLPICIHWLNSFLLFAISIVYNAFIMNDMWIVGFFLKPILHHWNSCNFQRFRLIALKMEIIKHYRLQQKMSYGYDLCIDMRSELHSNILFHNKRGTFATCSAVFVLWIEIMQFLFLVFSPSQNSWRTVLFSPKINFDGTSTINSNIKR